ncbi:MAG: pantoate--beta-alanine ligase [Pseudomonadota bacterium]
MFDHLPILVSASQVKSKVKSWRAFGEKIAFVPTRGSLHEGHVSLIREAQRLAERVLVSVYSNGETRDRDNDLDLLDQERVDAIYTPTEASFFPPGFALRIDVAGLSDVMEGRDDPERLRTQTLVILKQVIQAQPDLLLICESNWQQLALVRRVLQDLDMAIDVQSVPASRDDDGIAYSAALSALSDDERRTARRLFPSLRSAAEAVAADDGAADAAAAEAAAALREAGAEVDYVEVRAERSLAAAAERGEEPLRVFGAIRVGGHRLLDSVAVGG